MRILYDIFFIIFSIFYIPTLLLKGKLHKGFTEKLGFLPRKIQDIQKPVWIHAVSVGEAVLAARLAASIKKRFPKISIVVSTTTSTGNSMIAKEGNGAVDAVFYYPLDLSFVVRRAVRLIDPRLYIMIETELWPNVLEELDRGHVPVALVNGRISDASFNNYGRIKAVTKHIFKQITVYCMQSGEDSRRIAALGGVRERAVITGNMKFDCVVTPDEKGFEKENLGFGPGRRIIMAGSTHYPEESLIIDIYKRLKIKYGDLALVIVPRHVERRDAIKVYMEKAGLTYAFFSDLIKNAGSPDEKDVLLVDTIGHLKRLYACADIVFTGGSLVKKGGQNPVEPAIWGKPVIFGPHMYNFREITSIFLENNAAIKVKDQNELEEKLSFLLYDPGERGKLALNARNVVLRNTGAIDRTVNEISRILSA